MTQTEAASRAVYSMIVNKERLRRTTDFGTEAAVPDFRTTDATSLLPEWIHPALEDLAADPLDQPEMLDGAANRPMPILPRSLIVPGSLHLLHNMCSDLHARLHWWPQFWIFLKACEALLCQQHLLEKFVATCLSSTVYEHHTRDFTRIGCPRLFEKRWGVAVQFLRVLLPRLPVLQAAFRAHLFSGEASLQKLSTALSSPLFHAYCYMVHSLHHVIEQFTNWVETCSCHEGLFKEGKRGKRKHIACPMRGRTFCVGQRQAWLV